MRKSVLFLVAFLILATGVTVGAISGHYLPTYTFATLPTPQSAGRMAVVTNDIGGVWYDNGTAWTSILPTTYAQWVRQHSSMAYLGIGSTVSSPPLARLHIQGAGGASSTVRIQAYGVLNGAQLALIPSSGGNGMEWTADTDGSVFIDDFVTKEVFARFHPAGGFSVGNITTGGAGNINIANLRSYRAMDTTNTTRFVAGIDGSNNLNFGDNGLTALRFFVNGAYQVTIPSTGGLTVRSVTFANLGTPTNGTHVFCSDCDPTATLSACTHVGAQTGGFAFGVNGAWKCMG